jgi:formate-dependent phosphoribosylglycinamide formyltransferase (GAR transformylase)
MAKVNFTLKNITKEIARAEKKLRAIRGKVVAADQKKIDLELRGLVECGKTVKHFCRPLVHYGQTFTAKSKKK